LFTDQRIAGFSQNTTPIDLLEQEKERSGREHQLKLLTSLFDYKAEIGEINELKKYLNEHKDSFNSESEQWINQLTEKITILQTTAEKFHIQLQKLFGGHEKSEIKSSLQKRVKAAATYFTSEQAQLIELIQRSPATTDSRIHAKEANETLKELFIRLSMKKHLLNGIGDQFDTERYYNQKKSFVAPVFSLNAYAGVAKQKTESPNPALYLQLRKLRDEICAKKDLPIYIVAGSTTLDELAKFLPQTLSELRKINGFGDAKIEKYGQQFLDVILEYCKANRLSSLIHEKTPKKERKQNSDKKKPDTKAETFNLYEQGKSLAEIAKERLLTIQTIEGHLAHYVRLGEIDIKRLVNEEKIKEIDNVAKAFEGNSITSLKEKLGNGISFGEIKLVLAWLDFKKDSSS